jgi:hypothetical protein
MLGVNPKRIVRSLNVAQDLVECKVVTERRHRCVTIEWATDDPGPLLIKLTPDRTYRLRTDSRRREDGEETFSTR